MGERFRTTLLKYRPAAVFLVVGLPLAAGIALSGPLLRNRTLAASAIVREERAVGVLASVEGVRDDTRSLLLSLLPGAEGRTTSALREILRETGWEVYPGVFSAGTEVAGVPRSFPRGIDNSRNSLAAASERNVS